MWGLGRRWWGLLLGLVILVVAGGGLGYGYWVANRVTVVAVVPLDSRPCNTQYVEILGRMVGGEVLLPEAAALDDFLVPADEGALWRWLEQTADKADRLIISTNTLFNGGLINSRLAESYADTAAQLAQLEAFCRAHREQDITVMTILPRLKPSQFDDLLWPYEVALTAWGESLDRAQEQGQAQPAAPVGVPAEAAARYLALYEQSEMLTLKLAQLAQEGVITRYVVGQDDGQRWCPSNMIYRKLAALEIPNVTLIHGADELTMLLLADGVNTQPPMPVRLIYTNPARLGDYFPYEAADLATIVRDKLALAGLREDPRAEDVIIIHNDPTQGALVAQLVAQEQGHYLAIADVAYTNHGDPQLADLLLARDTFDGITCYAGWNTASNTLGTVFAHCRANEQLDKHYPWLSSRHRQDALTALNTFKYIRLTEDLIYQGLLSNALRTDLEAQAVMQYTTAFLPQQEARAQALLAERFAPYEAQLAALFVGDHEVSLGKHTARYSVSDFEMQVTFPWARAFEIKGDCRFRLK